MPRNNQSTIEDIVDITSSFHWGIGLVLAVTSYLFLHWYAGLEPPVSSDLSDISKNIAPQLFRSLAMFGQYVLPFVFLLGACISVFKRKKRSDLYQKTRSSKADNPLDDMSWRNAHRRVFQKARFFSA